MYFETQLLGWPYAMLSEPADWMANLEGPGRSEQPAPDRQPTDVTRFATQPAAARQES